MGKMVSNSFRMKCTEDMDFPQRHPFGIWGQSSARIRRPCPWGHQSGFPILALEFLGRMAVALVVGVHIAFLVLLVTIKK